jgi:maltooligosyltrehalose trehalohydrolase
LRKLVDACHAHGLALFLDVVYNHLGPAGNFLPEFGPYFSARHHTAWGAALNFDGEGGEEVRRFLVDNATMWVRDYHVDGLRLDAVHAMVDDSPRHILEEIAEAVHRAGTEAGRETFVIAESELNDPRLVKDRAGGGLGLDAAWADDWHHALHTTLTGERAGYYADFGSLAQLQKALCQAWVYDGAWSPHRGRFRGGAATGLPPHSFVVAAQNHDQVGNRAAGDRLSAFLDEDRLKVAAALLLTTQFTPMLFQGEEWSAGTPFLYFTGHPDRDLGRAVSQGRRREFEAFGWAPDAVPDPQDPGTFESSKLRWEELSEPFHRRMLDWYTQLIAVRRRLPAPRERIDVSVESGGRVSFSRPGVLVRANLANADWSFDLEQGQRVLMVSGAAHPAGPGVHLASWGVAIIETLPALV